MSYAVRSPYLSDAATGAPNPFGGQNLPYPGPDGSTQLPTLGGQNDGDIFNEVWTALGSGASSGAGFTGSIADTLIKAGYSVATISALLNSVASVSSATPAMLQRAQLEQQWLAQSQVQKPNLVPLIVIGGLLLWAVSRSRN